MQKRIKKRFGEGESGNSRNCCNTHGLQTLYPMKHDSLQQDFLTFLIGRVTKHKFKGSGKDEGFTVVTAIL